MGWILGILGALVGVLIELASPWADVIMQQVNSTLTDPSISSNLPLSALIKILGIIGAYLLLPSAFATGGFILGSSSH